MSHWESAYQGGNPRRWPNEMLVSWVSRRFGMRDAAQRKALTVLEVGCGAGGNLRYFADEGYTATGIDLAESAVLCCQASGHVALVRNVLATGFPDACFDVAVDVTCLQHLTDGEHLAALRELGRILKPCGWLWSYRLGYGTTAYRDIFPHEPPVWLPDEDDLKAQFKMAGWETEPTVLRHWREYALGGKAQRGWARYLVVEAQR